MKNWGGAILLVLLSQPMFAQVQLGETLPDITKSIAHISNLAPQHIADIEVVLKNNCPDVPNPIPRTQRDRACRFHEVVELHSQFVSEWQKLVTPDLSGMIPLITIAPGSDITSWRGGLWNVDPSRREEAAEASAQLFAHYIVSQRALRLAYVDVANWYQSIGNGSRGTFGEVIRPVIFAWLSSESPMGQLTELTEQMVCGDQQTACRTVRSEVAKASSVSMQPFVQSIGLLDQIENNAQLEAVLKLDSYLEEIFKSDLEQVIYWLRTNDSSRIPAISEYVKQLKLVASRRKLLMPGRYGMADEMMAVVLLSDLKRFAKEAKRIETAESLSLTDNSRAQIKASLAPLSKRLDRYQNGIKKIINELYTAPGA